MGAVELVNVFFSLVVWGVTDLDVDVWFCVIMEPYADGGKGLDAVFSAAGSPDAVVWSVMLIFGESNHVVQGIWRMGLGEEFVDTVKSGAARSSYFVIELCQIRQEEMVCVSQCPVLFCLYVPDAVFADFNVRDFMGVCHEKEARALEVIFHFERFFDRGAIAKECCESAALAVGEPYVFGNRFSDGGENGESCFDHSACQRHMIFVAAVNAVVTVYVALMVPHFLVHGVLIAVLHDDGSPAFDGAALSGKKRACLRLPWE